MKKELDSINKSLDNIEKSMDDCMVMLESMTNTLKDREEKVFWKFVHLNKLFEKSIKSGRSPSGSESK